MIHMHMPMDRDNLKFLSPGLHCLFCYCLVPHPRAQLFTYHHLQPPPPFANYRRKHQERQPILVAWQRVLSRSRRMESEEGGPIWRTAESHTRLVPVYGAGRRLQIDTDPPRLKLIYNQNMQNMQNMHNMTWAWHGNQNEKEHNMHNMHTIYNMHNITNMSLYEQYVEYD